MHPQKVVSRFHQARRALLRLLLTVLPVGAIAHPIETLQMILPAGPPRAPRPYLRYIPAPGLRFREPAPPVPETPVPTATVPSAPAPLPPVAEPPAPVSAPAPEEKKTAAPVPAATHEPVATTPPPAILPDDLRPRVRLEDFLPFFEPPGHAAEPPRTSAPAGQPPSSATYRQQ